MAHIPTHYETWTDPETGEVTGGRVVYGEADLPEPDGFTAGPFYIISTNDRAPGMPDPYGEFLAWLDALMAVPEPKPARPRRRGSPNPEAALSRGQQMRRVR
jgi:hypothetical protein